MLSMGICIASAVLAVVILLTGHAGPHLMDFSVAFLVVTAISFLASPVCARMPRDAGSAMTGHGSGWRSTPSGRQEITADPRP